MLKQAAASMRSGEQDFIRPEHTESGSEAMIGMDVLFEQNAAEVSSGSVTVKSH